MKFRAFLQKHSQPELAPFKIQLEPSDDGGYNWKVLKLHGAMPDIQVGGFYTTAAIGYGFTENDANDKAHKWITGRSEVDVWPED